MLAARSAEFGAAISDGRPRPCVDSAFGPVPDACRGFERRCGVAFSHTEDFAGAIPEARLVDTGADSHCFWLGAARQAALDTIRDSMAEVLIGVFRGGW